MWNGEEETVWTVSITEQIKNRVCGKLCLRARRSGRGVQEEEEEDGDGEGEIGREVAGEVCVGV